MMKMTKKEKKRLKEIKKLVCPKCSHRVVVHEAFIGSMYAMIYGSTSNACKEQVESRDDKGFIRLTPCPCDLSPGEAYENAKRSVIEKPLNPDDLLRGLK